MTTAAVPAHLRTRPPRGGGARRRSRGDQRGFTPFVVGGIVKAVIAGIALPGAWWLVNRGDRLG